MEIIECTAGEVDDELLRWADAVELWDVLRLGYFAYVSEDILPRTKGIDVEVSRPPIRADYFDPSSHEAVISFVDADSARRNFISAILDFAAENKIRIINEFVGSRHVPEDDVDEPFIATDAKAFRKK